jgi:V8-like Glu-specific endopeptidase
LRLQFISATEFFIFDFYCSALYLLGFLDSVQALPNENVFPYAGICRLDVRLDIGTIAGTGWLAGERLILTAAHCLFRPEFARRGVPQSVTCTFGSGRSLTIEDLDAFRTHKLWWAQRDSSIDIGGVLLPRSIGIRSLSVSRLTSPGVTIEIAGFPQRQARMLRATGPHINTFGRRIFYSVDVDDGQSGSPLLVREGGSLAAVGIHTSNVATLIRSRLRQEANQGIEFDDLLFRLVRDWRAR